MFSDFLVRTRMTTHLTSRDNVCLKWTSMPSCLSSARHAGVRDQNRRVPILPKRSAFGTHRCGKMALTGHETVSNWFEYWVYLNVKKTGNSQYIQFIAVKQHLREQKIWTYFFQNMLLHPVCAICCISSLHLEVSTFQPPCILVPKTKSPLLSHKSHAQLSPTFASHSKLLVACFGHKRTSKNGSTMKTHPLITNPNKTSATAVLIKCFPAFCKTLCSTCTCIVWPCLVQSTIINEILPQ